MKRILFVLSFLMAKEGSSQVIPNELVIKQSDIRLNVMIKRNKTFSAGYTNNVSANMIRDFMDKFENAKNVRWIVDDKDATANFNCDDEDITVRYRKDGYHLSTKKDYDGTKLNPVVAAFLEQELGAAFVINLVTELTREDDTIFWISLHNGDLLCIIQLYKSKNDEKLIIIDKKLLTQG